MRLTDGAKKFLLFAPSTHWTARIAHQKLKRHEQLARIQLIEGNRIKHVVRYERLTVAKRNTGNDNHLDKTQMASKLIHHFQCH